MHNEINIAFITDKNFVIQTQVAIQSLICNKNKDSLYNIFVITKDITHEQQNNFLKLQCENVKISVIEKDIYISKAGKINDDLPMIFWRLKLPNFFTGMTKILHLDCDIIVKKDLTELYNTNIDDYYIAAVRDIAPTIYHAERGKIYNKYFNAGIMLLNLEKIRAESFFERILNIAFEHYNEYFFHEQDILNNEIEDKIKLISYKYNFIASNCRYTKKQLQKFYREIFDKNEIVIIHYAGKCRPWIFKYTYFCNIWNLFFKNSCYYYKFKLKYIPFLQMWVFLMAQSKIAQNTNLYKEIGIL